MSRFLLGAIPPKTKLTQQDARVSLGEEKVPKQMSSLAEYPRLGIRFRPSLL